MLKEKEECLILEKIFDSKNSKILLTFLNEF